MKKKEFLAGTVLLAASSALCLRLMKKVGERLKKQQEKTKETNKQINIPRRSRVYIPKSSKP